MGTTAARSDRYHHGDLRNALIDAATALASSGGPQAVVLREVARRVGVSPTAAYRHFDSHGDLLQEVKTRSLDALTDTMATSIVQAVTETDPRLAAIQRSKAAGRGYLMFAFNEPGLFRTAFHEVPSSAAPYTQRTGAPDKSAYRSYELLSSALDNLVAVGCMPAERRPGAEIAAWSAVHGFAVLVTEGPLSALHGDALMDAAESLLDQITVGLCTPVPAG
ncbi:TetR/AcrR family transcriptional regulator [Streptomyces sp. NPDC102274]|uniref:TetR/AcrR family transcriptional regulator n=1 Tax=Streptomyces sp. NPDC102274 TaxID=3366151 RepID=UPI003822F880